MSSNGPLGSCYEVLNEHLIGYVLRGQNEESTILHLFYFIHLYSKSNLQLVKEVTLYSLNLLNSNILSSSRWRNRLLRVKYIKKNK